MERIGDTYDPRGSPVVKSVPLSCPSMIIRMRRPRRELDVHPTKSSPVPILLIPLKGYPSLGKATVTLTQKVISFSAHALSTIPVRAATASIHEPNRRRRRVPLSSQWRPRSPLTTFSTTFPRQLKRSLGSSWLDRSRGIPVWGWVLPSLPLYRAEASGWPGPSLTISI